MRTQLLSAGQVSVRQTGRGLGLRTAFRVSENGRVSEAELSAARADLHDQADRSLRPGMSVEPTVLLNSGTNNAS